MEWRSNALKRLPWYSDWHYWETDFVRSSVKSAERYRKSAYVDTKAVQRWTVYPIGRGSIKYIWWEWQKCLTNLRMYGSKSRICRNAYTAWMRWQWGKVKFVNMKYLGVLKALPSCQVYSRHLSIYVKDRIIGTWQSTIRIMRYWRRTISSFDCGQSSGITVDIFCNGKRRDSHKSVLQKSYRY